MAHRKVTLSLPDAALAPAQEAARRAGVPFSSFAARALRNETLRQQLAVARLPEVPGWLDDAEADDQRTT